MIQHPVKDGVAPRVATSLLALLALLVSFAPAHAQDDAPVYDEDALVDLVAPVALYPDDLLAIVLPAATYPLQVVEAQRLLEARERDPGLEPDPEWDDSIVALLNYPEALQLLNDDLDWTWQLGEAVLAQQGDVLEAVEVFRDQAWLAGNLETDDYQTVERSDEGIAIRPAAQDVIYVPYYDPDVVVVRNRRPVYFYHPHGYPLYYYPYPVGHRFYSDWFWGVSTAFTISWRHRYLHLHYFDHVGHPYYGRHYVSNRFYRHRRAFDHHVYRNGVRVVRRQGQAYRWHPRSRHGARPGYRRYGARNDTTLAYNNDRRVRTARTNRAARINNERRQRYRGVDNVVQRDQRNARRNGNNDRRGDSRSRRDTAAGGTRTQRFAANGNGRQRANRSERDPDRAERRLRRDSTTGARNPRYTTRDRDRNAGGTNRNRNAGTANRNRNSGTANRNRGDTRRFASNSRQTSRPAPRASRNDRNVRQATPPRAQRQTQRSQQRPAPRQRSESRTRSRSESRAPARQSSRSANRSSSRSSSRSSNRGSRDRDRRSRRN
ncbi:MAG: DUF3300 domain-containing protein [Pseudomonadota bacterium]